MTTIMGILEANPHNASTTFTVFLGGSPYELDLISELHFSFETLDECYIEHSAKVAFLCGCLDEGQIRLDEVEMEFNTYTQSLFLSYKELTTPSGKSYTESQIKAMVETEPDTIRLERELIFLRSYNRRLKDIIRIFETRFYAMQSYAATIRKTT